MNRPVYDSKGGNKSRVILLLVLAVILIVAAIYFFVLSGAEHEGVQVTISGTTGRLGGGPMFTEEGQNMLKIVSLVCVLIGALCADLAAWEASCWLKVYPDHIECQPVSLGLKKETLSIPVSQIASVSFNSKTGYVTVLSGGRAYKIACPRPEEAFRQIDALRIH